MTTQSLCSSLLDIFPHDALGELHRQGLQGRYGLGISSGLTRDGGQVLLYQMFKGLLLQDSRPPFVFQRHRQRPQNLARAAD